MNEEFMAMRFELTLLWRNEPGNGQRPIDIGIIDALAAHDHLGPQHLQGAECTIAMPHLEGKHKMGAGGNQWAAQFTAINRCIEATYVAG